MFGKIIKQETLNRHKGVPMPGFPPCFQGRSVPICPSAHTHKLIYYRLLLLCKTGALHTPDMSSQNSRHQVAGCRHCFECMQAWLRFRCVAGLAPPRRPSGPPSPNGHSCCSPDDTANTALCRHPENITWPSGLKCPVGANRCGPASTAAVAATRSSSAAVCDTLKNESNPQFCSPMQSISSCVNAS